MKRYSYRKLLTLNMFVFLLFRMKLLIYLD